MLTWPPTVKVFVCTLPTDMRRSFDGLAAMTRDVLGYDPLCGHLFVFFNRRRDRVKMLFWDYSGYCLHYKRLEEGTFRLPKHNSDTASVHMNMSQLLLILEGIDLSGAKRRKRFVLDPVSIVRRGPEGSGNGTSFG
jgi:transposase